MATVVVRRLLQLIPVVLLATTLVFVMVRLAPGDPAQQQLGARGARDPDRVAAFRHKLGLDQPIPVQYGIWLRYAVTGDLGTSVKNNACLRSDQTEARGHPGVDRGRAGHRRAIALALGTLAAVRAGSWIDQLTRVFVVTGLAIPTYWLGLIFLAHLRRQSEVAARAPGTCLR